MPRFIRVVSPRASRAVHGAGALLAAACVASAAHAQERAVDSRPRSGSASERGDSIARDARMAALEARIAALEAERRRAADSAKAAPRAPTLTAGPQGFALRSADGQFQMRLRGYVQSDGRFYYDDVRRPATGTFLLRRVRPIWEGTLYRNIDFRLMPDFGGGTATIYDAHIDVRIAPALAVRSGKFKPPIGLERLQSATDNAFIERAHPTNLVPNRDVGLQLYGDIARGTLAYAAGVFNGVPDLGFGDGDNGNGKDLIGRVFVLPFARSSVVALRELGLGIAGSRGVQRGAPGAPFLGAYRSPAQQSVFAYRTDGTAAGTTIADGKHVRVAPQGYYYGGPLGLMWEYVRSSQVVRRGATLARLDNHAWQQTATFVLTGERASFRGVTAARPFDPVRGRWGALELAGRVSQLTLDRDAFPLFADPATQVRDARTWGAGANWYLSRGVRLMVDYDETRYRGGAATGDRERERSVQTRVQTSF
jgi:phosphate-selective porin OprO/OprP